MKRYLYILLFTAVLYVVDWLWFKYHWYFTKLATSRTDGYHVTVRGRCYTK